MIVFCGLRLCYSQLTFCDSHVQAAHCSLVPRPSRGPRSACEPGYKATAHALAHARPTMQSIRLVHVYMLARVVFMCMCVCVCVCWGVGGLWIQQ